MGTKKLMAAPCLQEELADDELGYGLVKLGCPIRALLLYLSVFSLGLMKFFREDLCSLLPGGEISVYHHFEGLVEKRLRVSNCGIKLACYPPAVSMVPGVPQDRDPLFLPLQRINLPPFCGLWEGQSLGCRGVEGIWSI